ncbi:MAG: NAD(+) kinase [Moraxellaceae bacterium]|nr:MAG: NAD(+) kinase [Moraxellaceae bacterium]
MTQFSCIGLIGHLHNERATYSLKRLIGFLQKSGMQFVLEQETSGLLVNDPMYSAASKIVEINDLGKLCDLVIVVGGDGSLLRGARELAQYHVPLLGVNRGRLGFLTDIMPEDIELKVGEVLSGKYTLEERFLLDMEIKRNGNIVETGSALNDVVLHPGQFIHMLQYEIYVNGDFVTTQSSDGIIVSTPTGSTAYSLSGGGPLMDPKLDAIVLVPMNPHTLSSRPIVVAGSSKIMIRVAEHSRAVPMVTCDGDIHAEISLGDEIHIRKKPDLLKLLHPTDYNFYDRCRSKLGWGGHLLNN